MARIVKDNEEPDSSLDSWNYYRRIYTKELWALMSKFDLENVQTYEQKVKIAPKKIIRYLAYVKKEYAEDLGQMFAFGGDCDFNFNSKKRVLFQKILKDDNSNEILEQQLDYCCSMHHDKINFSLVATTGGLNNFKGKVHFVDNNIEFDKWQMKGLDRLDTFVHCLNDFFMRKNDLVLAAASAINRPYLEKYLRESFADIYDYCQKHYFIDENELIDEIIANGSKPIKTAKDLERYMSLAEKYWATKKAMINSK